MHRALTLLTLTALGLTGCGSAAESGARATIPSPQPPPSATTATTTAAPASSDENTGGHAEQVWSQDEFAGTHGATFTGTVRLRSNGCWLMTINGEDRLVAFPDGFSGADPTTVVGTDGLALVDGTDIDATGRVVWIEDVPGGRDSRWGNLLTYCAPDTVEIAVLDHVEPAFDPATWTESDTVEALRSAAFSTWLPCGFGFTASTADQRVGLVLSAGDPPAVGRTVTLPDDGWAAEVVVGKHLFVQHCDDAVEQWEADPVVVARWPIVAGRFAVEAPTDTIDGCGRSTAVRTQLTGGIVSTPVGEIDLPVIDAVNTAWGCFAG